MGERQMKSFYGRMVNPEIRENVTIDEGIRQWQNYNTARNLSPHSIRFYDDCTAIFKEFHDGGQLCGTITEALILDYIAFLRKREVKDTTVNSYMRAVRAMCYYFMKMYELFRACEDYIDETNYARNLELRQEIMRYSDHKLRYNISAGDRPEICWEFASLKAMIDLYIVGSITDTAAPIRECKHCGKVFYAENARLEFCSSQCRNKFNVYKFRRKEN